MTATQITAPDGSLWLPLLFVAATDVAAVHRDDSNRPRNIPASRYASTNRRMALYDEATVQAMLAAAPEFGGVAVAEVVHGEGGPGGVRLKLRAGVAWHQFPHGTQIFTHPPTDVASA